MSKWLRRIRGALLMGITWAAVWAPVGVLIGLIVDPNGTMDEPWILVGTIPGFLCGVAFSIVLGIAARRRGFSELSSGRFTAWGALAGLVIGVLPFMLGSSNPALPPWFPGVVIGSITALGALSAAGSLALARRGEKRELLTAAAYAPEISRTEREAQERVQNS